MSEGPYVRAALFCEAFFVREDGTMVIDGLINGRTYDPNDGRDGDPFVEHLKAFVSFSAGDYRGISRLEIQPPPEVEGDAYGANVTFADSGSGPWYLFEFGATFPGPGLYWFDIYLDGESITRIPFGIAPRA